MIGNEKQRAVAKSEKRDFATALFARFSFLNLLLFENAGNPYRSSSYRPI